MNNTQVSQNFAEHKTGKGSNLFIDNDTIFSYGYHFPIARHTDKTYQGKQIVLFTTRSYSHSTAKHKNHVGTALFKAGYYTLDVDCNCMDVLQWIKDKSQSIEDASNKAKRARTENMRAYWSNCRMAEIEQLGVINTLFI